MIQPPRPFFAVVATLLCAFAVWSGVVTRFGGVFRPLSGWNAPLYDASVELTGFFRARDWSKTLVVLVDQQTLDMPDWASVPRALQQPQLGRLADAALALGARRVGFDLVPAFDPRWIMLPFGSFSAYDATFARLLTRHADQIVLGIDASVAPAPRYAAMLPRTGLGAIDLVTEPDGVVRSVLTRTRLDGGVRVLGFAQALAEPSGPLASSHAFIFPRAPISRIPHLSASAFEACLANPAEKAALADLVRGRTVLIGAGLAGEDAHRGPARLLPEDDPAAGGAAPCRQGTSPIASRESGWLPGVFLQAAATESLLAPTPLSLAETPARVVTNLCVTLMAFALMARIEGWARLPDRRGWMFAGTLRAGLALLAAGALLALAAVALEVFALQVAQTWLPIGPTLAAIVLIGALQTIVSAMRRDIALADIRISFGRWLPRPVIEATLAARPAPVLGQERVITVLIADLMNFTSFCADHREEPQRIVAALNQKFSSAQGVIDRLDGCLDKFDGDAVIAFWNGIDDQPDHARRAVAAARDIVSRDRDDDALRFKCAVATGVAFVGCYGSERKSSFSAIGEPMNLAARLEALCRPHDLRIVIADTTRDACGRTRATSSRLQEPCFFEKIGEARLKGFPIPVAFFTIEPEGRADPPSASPSLANAFAVEHKA